MKKEYPWEFKEPLICKILLALDIWLEELSEKVGRLYVKMRARLSYKHRLYWARQYKGIPGYLQPEDVQKWSYFKKRRRGGVIKNVPNP